MQLEPTPYYGQGDKKEEGIQTRYRQGSVSCRSGDGSTGNQNRLFCLGAYSKPFSSASQNRTCADFDRNAAALTGIALRFIRTHRRYGRLLSGGKLPRIATG